MINWLLDWLFPIRCSGCGRYDTWLCTACQVRDCVPIQQPGVSAAALYQTESIQQLIHHLKYRGYRSVNHCLSQILYQSINWDEVDVVVPIPLHWRKRLTRGYNQTELLVRDWPAAIVPALKKIKSTRSQAKLNKPERQKNLHGAFAIDPHYQSLIHGKRVLLIDDVYSTGSTTAACTEVLLGAGVASVAVAVVALNVPSCGIEPQLQDPQSCVLSVERRGRISPDILL
ncbi:MAG: amidophosphoribosyltransferase-like protein [uncultured bacterium]|nr:MAG: amidophosphoribosyltransferase-like protein [uncultured bacterium]